MPSLVDDNSLIEVSDRCLSDSSEYEASVEWDLSNEFFIVYSGEAINLKKRIEVKKIHEFGCRDWYLTLER